MNKYNIDEHLYYNSFEIGKAEHFRPILVTVKKIEKIENGQLIYTVKFVSTVGWNTSDRNYKQPKEMDENCLYRDLDTLKEVHKKATHGRL